MKKLIAILMTIAMLCSVSVSAFAATTTEVEEITWADVADTAAEVDPDAAFVQIADWNLCMWLPSIFSEQELTDEDIENGYISYLTLEDESAAVAITMEAVECDLETLQEGALEAGIEEAEVLMINGIKMLVYTDEENDIINAVCQDEDDVELWFTFWPASDEGFEAVAYLMIASLQPIE